MAHIGTALLFSWTVGCSTESASGNVGDAGAVDSDVDFDAPIYRCCVDGPGNAPLECICPASGCGPYTGEPPPDCALASRMVEHHAGCGFVGVVELNIGARRVWYDEITHEFVGAEGCGDAPDACGGWCISIGVLPPKDCAFEVVRWCPEP